MSNSYQTYCRKLIILYMANVNAPVFQPAAAAKGVKSDIALSMVTLNMHGFNQSSDFLIDTCNSGVYDLIHI